MDKYHIDMRPNKVQNVVLDRAIKYAAYRECPLFWIDQKCMPENDPEKKKRAIYSMDLIYKLNKHSIALLEVKIHFDKELGLFADFL